MWAATQTTDAFVCSQARGKGGEEVLARVSLKHPVAEVLDDVAVILFLLSVLVWIAGLISMGVDLVLGSFLTRGEWLGILSAALFFLGVSFIVGVTSIAIDNVWCNHRFGDWRGVNEFRASAEPASDILPGHDFELAVEQKCVAECRWDDCDATKEKWRKVHWGAGNSPEDGETITPDQINQPRFHPT